MATKPKKIKTIEKRVAYRKAEFHNKKGHQTLEQLLLSALQGRPSIRDRREAIDAAASELRFISDWSDSLTAGVCGRLSTVQKQRLPVALLDNPDARSIPLKEFSPPSGHDYAPGICHFVVIENHVVLVQSSLLRTSALENHFAWFLRSKTNLLRSDQGISLSDVPQKATRDRIRKAHVKSVMIGRPVLEQSTIPQAASRGKSVFKADAKGPILKLLKSIIDSDEYGRLGLEDRVFGSNLEVWIEVRYPKRSRSQSQESVRLLDELSIALRDVDEEEVNIMLSDGSTVKGKELKVSSKIEVEVGSNGRSMIEKDLYMQMEICLRNWIKNGVVFPN